MALGDPEPEFLVLKILKSMDKFCQDLGWRNALNSLTLWVRVVVRTWSPQGSVRAMQDWPDQWHMTVRKLHAETDVHDFKIDRDWPKHKGPGESGKQLWEWGGQNRFGLKAKGEVPSRLSIRPRSEMAHEEDDCWTELPIYTSIEWANSIHLFRSNPNYFFMKPFLSTSVQWFLPLLVTEKPLAIAHIISSRAGHFHSPCRWLHQLHSPSTKRQIGKQVFKPKDGVLNISEWPWHSAKFWANKSCSINIYWLIHQSQTNNITERLWDLFLFLFKSCLNIYREGILGTCENESMYGPNIFRKGKVEWTVRFRSWSFRIILKLLVVLNIETSTTTYVTLGKMNSESQHLWL